MENFVFALNATVPVFLVMALGFVLQQVHFLNDASAVGCTCCGHLC